MRFFLIFIQLVFFSLLIFSEDSVYIQSIHEWHQTREQNLKKENGWLNLAGLFLLKEGKNTVGAHPKNNIVFPKGKCVPFLGTIYLKNNQVSINIKKNVTVLQNNTRVTSLLIYKEDEQPVVLNHKSLRWFVIKRGNDYYIRLRDLESKQNQLFKGIDCYPVDKKWNMEAHLDTTAKDTVEIIDVLGNINKEISAGKVVFTLNGNTYRLDALDEVENLFILFSDKTNEYATYYTGRFLTVKKKDANGKLFLDFNKSFNPPCAFTDFATCPLPPKQNYLPIAIEAGEKRYGVHK